MRRFRTTGNKTSLWAYGFLNTWLVVGFGFVDGFWNHTVKLIGFQLHSLLSLHGGVTNTVEKSFEGNLIYQATGILTFVASIFAAYYGYKFIRIGMQSKITSTQNN